MAIIMTYLLSLLHLIMKYTLRQSGAAQSGAARGGAAQSGAAQSGAARCGAARCGAARGGAEYHNQSRVPQPALCYCIALRQETVRILYTEPNEYTIYISI